MEISTQNVVLSTASFAGTPNKPAKYLNRSGGSSTSISKLVSAAVVALLLLFNLTTSATNVVYTVSTTTCAPTFTTSPAVTGLTFSNITKGSGVTCVPVGNGIGGNTFNSADAATALSANKYNTLSVTADASTTFLFNAFTLAHAASGTGAKYDVQYSIGAGAKTSIGTITTLSTGGTQTFTLGTPVTVSPSQVLNIFIICYGTSTGTVTVRTITNTAIDVTVVSAPTVTTTATPSVISSSGATLQGNISSNGGSALTGSGIVYSLTSTNATPAISGTGVTQLAVGSPAVGAISQATVAALSPNAQYSYRAYAINSVGTSYGGASGTTFYTYANVPSAPSVTNPTSTTLDVAVNTNSNPSITEYAIKDVASGNYVQANGSLGATAVWQTATTWGTKTVTGLTPSTSYNFQVKARNNAATQVETAFSSSGNNSTTASGSPSAVNSSLTATATYGVAFSYFITGTNAPTSYNATGMPAWMSVNTSTGELTGTPTTTAGSPITVSISASNGVGSAGPSNLSITINPKPLTISGISIAGKTYDQTNAATISGTPSLVGVLAGDLGNVSLGGSPSATFNSVNVGATVLVTVSGYSISGSASSNYSLTQPTGLTGAITAKSITVTGIAIADKTYNGLTTGGVITGTAALSGVISPDAVTLGGSPTATFASANVGTGIGVTIAGYSITGGAQAGNYTLTQPTGLTGNIIKANQTINFPALSNQTTGAADYSPGATSTTSGTNPISYASSNTAVATIVSGNIHIVGVGTTTITASQGGSANYNAASDVSQSLTVTAGPCMSTAFPTSGWPSGWTSSTALNNTTAANYNSGPNSKQITAATNIISGQVDFPISVSFYAKGSGASGGQIGTIEYMLGSSGTWTAISPTSTYTVTATMQLFTLNITGVPNSSTAVSFRFTTNASSIYIDDINVYCGTPVCTGPTLTTSAATSVTTNSAVLNGNITLVGQYGATTVTTRGFEYSTSSALASPTVISTTGSYGTGAYTGTIASGLTPNTVYYFNAYGINDCSTPTRGDAYVSGYPTFTTVHNAPTVGSGSAATTTSFTASWTAPIGGGSATYTYEIQVDDDINFGSVNFTQSGIASGTTTANVNSGLSPSTPYYFRVRAVNAGGNSAWSSPSAAYSTATPTPAIAVTSYANNSTFTYANVGDGGTYFLDQTFTITNSGTAALDLTANGGIVVSGTGFALTGAIPSSVAAGGSANFKVRFNPTTAGAYSGNVKIGNNATPSIYTINLAATSVPSSSYPNGDFVSITGTGLSYTAASTWMKVTNGILGVAGADGTPSGSSNIWVRGEISTNGSGSVADVVIESGGKLQTVSSPYTIDNLLIKNGGTFLMGVYITMATTSSVFEVESGGTFIYAYTNTSSRSTGLWKGIEKFHSGSNFTIQNAQNTSGFLIIEANSDVSTYTDGASTACFGNFIVDLGAVSSSIGLFPAGFNKQLTHNDLIFRTASGNITMSAGTYTTIVGGDLKIESTYGSNLSMINAAFTASITVNGNFSHAGSAAFRLCSSSTTTTSTLVVKGDINVSGTGTLDFNATAGTGMTPTIDLYGDITVGSTALFTHGNTNTGANLGAINFKGTGDGLTAATTQTIDINTSSHASTANRNRRMAFAVKNGAYVQLANRNLDLGNSSTFVVENGGVLDFGYNGTDGWNLTPVPSSTLTSFNANTGSTLKITSSDAVGAIVTVATGTNGNVRLASRTYNANAIYHYIGKANQVVGDGLPTTPTNKVIVEMNSDALTLTVNTTPRTMNTPAVLEIRKGTLLENATSQYISGTGLLTMSGGIYQIASVGVLPLTLPRLTGTYALTGGSVELNGTSSQQHLRGGRTYYGVTISGAAPGAVLKDITGDIIVNGPLNFTNGILTTNANKVTVSSTGTVTGASQATGWVNGYLERYIPSGTNVARNFQIGDASNYTPINTVFSSVSAPNYILSSTVATDHPNIATSNIKASRSINRYWRMVDAGVVFTDASATFNFVDGDKDAGVNTGNVYGAEYAASAWSFPTQGTKAANSTQVTGLTNFGEFQLGEVSIFTWGGTVDSSWVNASNWIPTGLPNDCAQDIYIPFGTPRTPVISTAAANVGTVNIESGVVLTLRGQDMNVCGNWVSGTSTDAAVLGSGTVLLTGTTTQQQISGNTVFKTLQINNTQGAALASGATVDIETGLHLQAGNLNVTQGSLTLISNALNPNSYIDDFSFGGTPGTITGSISAQRYIPVAGYNQHFLSSPVSAPALSQINASGPDGSYVGPTADCDETKSDQHSPYGSVFEYDDNHATAGQCKLANWKVRSAGNMVNAKGYSVYLNGKTVKTLQGLANTGNMSVSGLANKGTAPVPTKQSPLTPIESGWNLVGNPYPSTINLTTSRLAAGFANQVAIWVTTGPFTGSWQTKVIGVDANIKVAPFQAFMVLRTAAGSGSYPFYQSERIRENNTPFYRNDLPNSLDVEVNYNGDKDVTTVQFNPAASVGFDDALDANKPSGSINRPMLFTHLNANRGYSINTLPSLTETTVVPMGLRPGNTGEMTFTFNGVESFDATTYIMLEDKKTNTWHNLRNGSYTFRTVEGENQDRFVLHFAPPTQILTSDASCDAAGEINIQQPGTSIWNYTVTDQNNSTISTGTLHNTNPISVSVSAGTYTLTLVDNTNYSVVKTVEVGGLQPVVATFVPSASTVQVQDNITFNSATNNAVSYIWQFGDGSTATGMNASHSYQSEGVYTVTLTVTSAGGCTSTTTRSITVTSRSVTGINNLTDSKLNIWSHDNTVYVDFGKQGKVEAEIEVYDILGQVLSSEKYGRSTIYAKQVPNLEMAYVIVKVKNGDVITTKKLLISNGK